MHALFAVLFVFLAGSSAFSVPRTLTVPADYPTLKEAVAAAEQGSTIVLKPGTYRESVVIRKGLTIQGEEPGQVILSVPANTGRLISVETGEPVRIENLVLEHTDHAAFDEKKHDRSGLLGVDGGSIEVRHCLFRDGITSGLAFTKETVGVAEDCKAEHNRGTGFLVRDGGTAKLIRCEANENYQSGMAVCDGAGAEIEGSIACKNGYAGIQGLPVESAALIVRNCRTEENKSSGIYLTGSQAGTVEGNTCIKNGRYGIELTNKTHANVRKNTCTGNILGGIHATAILTDVVLEENTVCGNGQCGILVEYAVKARIVGNTVSRNGETGIAARNLETKADIIGNTCEENPVFGIVACMGALGTAKDNVCRKNGKWGLGVYDPETDVTIGENTLEENGTEQLIVSKEWWPSCLVQVEGYYAGWGLSQRQYDYLESLAAWADAQKDDSASLDRLIYGTTEAYYPENYTAVEQHTPKVREWVEKYPKSAAARNTLAATFSKRAWEARDGDAAYEVSAEGWKGFEKHLKEAEQVLVDMEKEGLGDALTYSIWIDVGTSLNYPESRVRELFRKGYEFSPAHLDLYWNMANYLLPRWHGSPGQLAGFFEQAHKLTKESKGERMYAFIVASYLFDFSHGAIMSGKVADWERVRAGFEQYLKDSPDTPYYLNRYCQAACRFEKRELAAKLFDQIGDRYERMAWVMHNSKAEEEKIFKQCRRWAKFDNVPYPFADRMTVLGSPLESKTADGVVFMLQQTWFVLEGVLVAVIVLVIMPLAVIRYRRRRQHAHAEPPPIPASEEDKSPDV